MRPGGSLPVRSINAPAWLYGADFSDHLNYWAAGIPAVTISDTSFLRNLNYHTANDTVQTLDFRRMAEVVKDVYVLAHAAAR